jgi:Holliday junction DNA helicase RuvA
MIGYLTGSVIKEASRNSNLVIDVNGVGYNVVVTPKTFSSCYNASGSVSLNIFTRVKEDGITLYGFENLAQLSAFEKLISIHGVGAALALTILASLSLNDLGEAILTNDVKLLSTIPGIGSKTAQRLIIELKTAQFGEIDHTISSIDSVAIGTGLGTKQVVKQALTELGYSQLEIRAAIEIADDDLSEEELLKAALKNLVSQH